MSDANQARRAIGAGDDPGTLVGPVERRGAGRPAAGVEDLTAGIAHAAIGEGGVPRLRQDFFQCVAAERAIRVPPRGAGDAGAERHLAGRAAGGIGVGDAQQRILWRGEARAGAGADGRAIGEDEGAIGGEDGGDGGEGTLRGQADMARRHAQAAEVEDGAGGVLKGAGDAGGREGAAALLGGGVEGEDEVTDADLLDGLLGAVGHEDGGAGEEAAGSSV